MIEIISPAGFEKYFMELAEATAAAGGVRPDPSVTAPIAERFGLSFDFTEVPDLVARHGLRSPSLASRVPVAARAPFDGCAAKRTPPGRSQLPAASEQTRDDKNAAYGDGTLDRVLDDGSAARCAPNRTGSRAASR